VIWADEARGNMSFQSSMARGLTQNAELLHPAPNPRGDALAFLREELGRFGLRLAP